VSRIAPVVGRVEQRAIARALGCTPLRLRGGRPPRKVGPRLQVGLPPGVAPDGFAADPLWLQLLAAAGAGSNEWEPHSGASSLPLLHLPLLSELRASAAARRALWPQLRALRKALANA